MGEFDLKKYLTEGKLLNEKVKVTKKGAGLQDYKLVYKGVVAYAYKQEDGSWTMYDYDGYSNESGAWANQLRTLKQCKEDLMYAVDFEGHTNPNFKSK